MIKLVERDLRILAILQEEGRITKTDLAARVNLSPTPFGGMKHSGLEREGSRLGMEAFTEVNYVCRDWA